MCWGMADSVNILEMIIRLEVLGMVRFSSSVKEYNITRFIGTDLPEVLKNIKFLRAFEVLRNFMCLVMSNSLEGCRNVRFSQALDRPYKNYS